MSSSASSTALLLSPHHARSGITSCGINGTPTRTQSSSGACAPHVAPNTFPVSISTSRMRSITSRFTS
jgi:hypothetical protein